MKCAQGDQRGVRGATGADSAALAAAPSEPQNPLGQSRQRFILCSYTARLLGAFSAKRRSLSGFVVLGSRFGD